MSDRGGKRRFSAPTYAAKFKTFGHSARPSFFKGSRFQKDRAASTADDAGIKAIVLFACPSSFDRSRFPKDMT
jgi:hypothetical protein